VFDFHEKRKLKGYLYSTPMIVGLFLFSALLSTSVYARYLSEREMAGKRETLSRELDVLKMKASALEAEVAHLHSDRGIEEEIRDRYEVSKKGEQVVVILESAEDKKATITPIVQSEDEKGSFWSFLW